MGPQSLEPMVRDALRTWVLALFAVAFLAAPSGADAQAAVDESSVELRGQVSDDRTGTPLNNVAVRLPDLNLWTVTNSEGWFRFEAVPSGEHRVIVSGFGFHEFETSLVADGESVARIRLEPRAIELEGLYVLAEGALDDRARHDAFSMNAHHRIFHRDQIVESGFDDPFDFLRRVAGTVITGCRNARDEQLCTLPPFFQAGEGVLRVGARIEAATGAIGTLPSVRWTELAGSVSQRVGSPGRASVTERTTINNAFAAASRVPRARAVQVLLDDRPLPGGLNGLAELNMEEIHRVETFGYRGERGIRLYTLDYLWRLGEADLRPGLLLSPEDRFQRTDPDVGGPPGSPPGPRPR